MNARSIGARGERGVSLIELMIALAIGTFLVLGLVRVFSASRVAYQLSEGVSRVQENGRFAVDFIQRDLRMVGHMGCVNDQAHLQNAGALQWSGFPVATPATSGTNFPISIQAYEATKTTSTSINLATAAATWVPGLPSAVSSLSPSPSAGSDVLQMRFLASEGVPVSSISVSGSSSTITVPAARWTAFTADGVATPTMFGLADCSYVNLFNATGTNAASGQVTVNAVLDRFTPQPAGQTMLYRIESVVYYVGLNASGQRSLWRARARPNGTYATPEELVEGIESMQLQIGLDRNVAAMPVKSPSGYIGSFVSPSAVTNTEVNWRAVGAVRLGLLVASANPSASSQPIVSRMVLGTSISPADTADNRYRFAYETTVAMRNRLYGN